MFSNVSSSNQEKTFRLTIHSSFIIHRNYCAFSFSLNYSHINVREPYWIIHEIWDNQARGHCIELRTLKKKNVPIENPGFFKYIAEIYVRVQEVWIQSYSFLEMMYGKPNFSLGIEYTSEITPRHREIGSRFDSFQVTCLQKVRTRKR